jgi:aconitase A
LLGVPPAPIPTGIGVIGVPAAGATAASAIAALGSSPLSPDIAEVTMRTGIAPCHVAGTDIAPTNRA